MNNFIKNLLSCIAVIFLPLWLSAQGLAAFSDLQYKFYVFDAGKITKVEDLRVQSFQIGGNCIAYIDNSGELKAYYRGDIYSLDNGGEVIKYVATDYLLGYKIFDFLKVFENGKVTTLCTAVEDYTIQDSLIAWYDRVEQRIKAYYKGEIVILEDGLLSFPVDNFRSGDNILAYVTTADNSFKVFYRGETQVLDYFGDNMIYRAGRDLVAFMDVPRNIFKVFYKGEIFELEYFKPKSFMTGDGTVVYVDNSGNFKIFENGVVNEILSYEPDSYLVVDNVMIFIDAGQFKTWCDNYVQVIERYIPSEYILDWHTIGYIDENQNIRAVQNCEKFVVTYDRVQDISLIRDLIIFDTGAGAYQIYYLGRFYER